MDGQNPAPLSIHGSGYPPPKKNEVRRSPAFSGLSREAMPAHLHLAHDLRGIVWLGLSGGVLKQQAKKRTLPEPPNPRTPSKWTPTRTWSILLTFKKGGSLPKIMVGHDPCLICLRRRLQVLLLVSKRKPHALPADTRQSTPARRGYARAGSLRLHQQANESDRRNA